MALDVVSYSRLMGIDEEGTLGALNRVPITGRLIDAATGAHIWADPLRRGARRHLRASGPDCLPVAGAIEPNLRQSEIERATRKPTESLCAHDLCLRALAQFDRYTKEGLAKAVALLQQTLAIDPSYAPAALAGWCCIQRGALSDADVAKAIRPSRQALEAARDDPDTM
jgi:hypothetical protein